MKYLVLGTVITGILFLAPAASADGRFGRGFDRNYNYGFYGGHDRFRGHGYNRYRSPARYRSYYQPGGSYWNLSFGNHYGHRRLDGGALLGGLVLGSILGRSTVTPRYESYTSPQTSRVRVIQSSPVVTRTSGLQRRLLRDLSGRCYEIGMNSAGNEMRIELDPSVCSF